MGENKPGGQRTQYASAKRVHGRGGEGEERKRPLSGESNSLERTKEKQGNRDGTQFLKTEESWDLRQLRAEEETIRK